MDDERLPRELRWRLQDENYRMRLQDWWLLDRIKHPERWHFDGQEWWPELSWWMPLAFFGIGAAIIAAGFLLIWWFCAISQAVP